MLLSSTVRPLPVASYETSAVSYACAAFRSAIFCSIMGTSSSLMLYKAKSNADTIMSAPGTRNTMRLMPPCISGVIAASAA